MGRIYDENAIEVGHAQRLSVSGLMLNVNHAPNGEWLVDAGGTDVVAIRAADGGGFLVGADAAPAYRSAFPAAMQLALRRLGL